MEPNFSLSLLLLFISFVSISLFVIFYCHDTASASSTFIVKYLVELPHIYNEVYEEQVELLTPKHQAS
ncbi:hypothetical protein CRG98_042457 [Punica granatum]|uniref:Uncharacterized protein n=1 Tax=Punica granatum TaxID=22663 RepID=A0A2I0HZI7_PUNGR|nr:hypothetical protein CRG98_042457 [Punica granatum]